MGGSKAAEYLLHGATTSRVGAFLHWEWGLTLNGEYRLIITLNKFFSDSSLYFYDDYKELVTFACSWNF